jgi:hypothetical protein
MWRRRTATPGGHYPVVNVLDGMRRGGREGAAAEILVVWREKMYGRGRTHDAGCGKDLVCHAERTRRGTLGTGRGNVTRGESSSRAENMTRENFVSILIFLINI